MAEVFLDLPKIGALTGEGGTVYFAQGGEPLAVMLPEVAKDRLIGVDTQELTDDLDGEDLGV